MGENEFSDHCLGKSHMLVSRKSLLFTRKISWHAGKCSGVVCPLSCGLAGQCREANPPLARDWVWKMVCV